VSEGTQEGLDIRQWGRLVWRRKWLLLAIVIAIPTAVYALSSLLPKTYESKATINIQPTPSAASLFSHVSAKSEVGETQTLIRTAIVGRRAARILGEPAAASRSLIGHISVAPTSPTENDSSFLTITARDSNPVRAAEIANAFAQAVARARTASAIHEINRAIRTLEKQSEAATDESTRDALDLQLQELLGLRAGQSGTTTIIEAATPASSPISPQPGRNTAIALILALLIAAAIAPLLDRLDRRIREPGELGDLLEAPLLAAIPDDAFPGHPPGPHVRESFETLRASLTYFNVDRSLSSLIVASPVQQDGKTTVAINLALAYALDERDVVLVDGDLRRPQVAVRLGKEVSVGLESVLIGERTLDEALAYVDTGAGRLRILPGVVPPPNPAVLLGSPRMQALLAELTEQVDMVVIDTPGLLAVSDAIPLFNQAVGSIIVSRLNRTPSDAVQRARQVIESAGGTVLGGVATGAHAGGLYGYYGYYGYSGGESGANGAKPKNGAGKLRGLASGAFRRSG
jgi:capsular exopolysaccharide synthesis family protein